MTQNEAFEMLKIGNNTLITGSAGSGKTHLINRYITYLKDHNVDVAVTASTGIAATHMGGTTIHSWSGLGVRDSLSAYDLESLESKQYLWKRFESVKVLIIDEISMMHDFRLDMIESIIRHFKRNSKPFGGIQVVLVGDFFQLPPIVRMGEAKSPFIFKSNSWKAGKFTICYLNSQHRQKDDKFISILNAIRSNNMDDKSRAHLHSRKNAQIDLSIEPTRLYTHNIDVDYVNDLELNKLDGEATEYQMTSKGPSRYTDIIKKSCLAPEILKLKVGAKVMCVKNNFEAGFVNGTLGIVVACDKYQDPVIRVANGQEIKIEPMPWEMADEDGKVKAEIKQYPLRLAWAITVHKCQGMSLDAIEVDLSKSFEKGMGYVALSRVRSLEGLCLLGINDNAFLVNEEVLEYDSELKEKSDDAVQALKNTPEKKLKQLQDDFLSSITDVKSKEKNKKRTTVDITRDFVVAKIPLAQIAKERKMSIDTIVSHIEKIIESDQNTEVDYLIEHFSVAKTEKIRDAILDLVKKDPEKILLTPVKEKLGSSATFLEIRLIRLVMRKNGLI